MRILVTGGSGFLGRHLLPHLDGHEVVALTRGNRAAHSPDNVEWLPMDLSQGLDASKLPSHCDAIIHLAQSDRYREFPAGAADVFRVNVAVPASLMRWAVDAGVTRAVFASSGSVYEPFTGPLNEEAAVCPTGFYGASKLAAETLTLAYLGKLAVAQLRVFFLYGPGQSNMMVSRLVDSVRNGATLTLPREGDGLEFVPTYVDDTARIFAAACTEEWHGIWNVASPHVVSFRQLAEEIGGAVGRPPVFKRTEGVPPLRIVPDVCKLASRCNLRFMDIREGIARTTAG